MRKSEIIKRILLNTKVAHDEEEAQRIFIQTFVDHYLALDLKKWDTEVADSFASSFIRLAGNTNHGISVRYLIKDLDTMLRDHPPLSDKNTLA